MEGEVPDKAGVRVIRRGRGAVRCRHHGLAAVSAIHITVGLHVVTVEHVGTCRRTDVIDKLIKTINSCITHDLGTRFPQLYLETKVLLER